MNKFLLTFAAGVAIGIILAPAKGSETRKKIKQRLGGMNDELDRLFNSEQRMFDNAIDTIKETAQID